MKRDKVECRLPHHMRSTALRLLSFLSMIFRLVRSLSQRNGVAISKSIFGNDIGDEVVYFSKC